MTLHTNIIMITKNWRQMWKVWCSNSCSVMVGFVAYKLEIGASNLSGGRIILQAIW